MQLFYIEDFEPNKNNIFFPKEESRHIIKVLRKKIGDNVFFTNGKGKRFTAEITVADTKQCMAAIISSEEIKPKNYQLHLAVAPTKMNERYEWFLEKATEIGIDSITPIICKHSERKTIKPDRFERVIQSAMKQSLQYFKPQLNEAISIENFLNQKHQGKLYIAHCEDTEKQSIKEIITTEQSYTILIGPEGDFSPKEITLAKEKNFIPISLGENRLRTETAAIVACSYISFINQ